MRYEGLTNIVNLAIRMQGLHGGMTLDDIRAEFGVSRRTAERMRDAVEWAFGPLDIAESDDNRRHWRLRSDALRRLVRISAAELADLSVAAGILDNSGFGEPHASALRELDTKLRATLHTGSPARIEADMEALAQAEGLAMRPGPRPRLDSDLLALLSARPSPPAALSRSAIWHGPRAGEAASASNPTACYTATAPSWWGGRTGPTTCGSGASRT